jgi:CDP-diacylglycerol pyrophosphatase
MSAPRDRRMSGLKRRRGVIAIAVVLLAGLALVAITARADPNVLWNIVHGQCVPDQQQHGNPSPCARVDLSGGEAAGFAVLKDIKGATQFLLIPTRPIDGIESGVLLAPDAPNYFAAAWQGSDLVAAKLSHSPPRDVLSLAVNSNISRSQNQLHIHIDCLRGDVHDALARAAPLVGPHWTLLPMPLAGHRYRAMRVDGETLGDNDPFKLLARGMPGAAADMGHHTLVVVGMGFDGGPGFIILDDQAGLTDLAHGEDLQDHDCALGR